MDPASAGVALVGFAASITTLTAVALESSKTLYNLRKRLQSTPEDVRRLIRQVQIFESLLQAIQRALQVNRDLGVPQDLQEIWEGSTDLMREDMERFKLIVSRLQRLLDGPTVSSKLIKLRIRQIFDEETVKGFQERISSHIENLTLIQTTVNHRKLDAVSHHATRLADVSSIAFQTICSKLDNAESSSYGRYKRYQESLDLMDDRLQLLQNQLELGPFRPSSSLVRPAIVGKRERPGDKTVAATISWTSRSYSLPIGTLYVRVRKKRKCSRSTESGVGSEQSSINITFAPPRWLSSIMLRYDLELCRDHKSSFPGLTFNITPFTLNNNPLLFQAIREADVAGLRRLFQAGLARPTDHIRGFMGTCAPISLLDFYCDWLSDFPSSQCYDMYQFLLENCGPVTVEALPVAFWRPSRINSDVENYSYRSYIAAFVAHGGQLLTERDKNIADGPYGSLFYSANYETILSVLVEGGLEFDCIQDCLLRQVEPWIMEDLAQIDAWYISVLAHTNRAFRGAIKKHIDSYRSPFCATGRSARNDSFESVFGVKSIVAQLNGAPQAATIKFLHTIRFLGTYTMLKPFLDAVVDVNRDRQFDDPLRNAGADGRVEKFHMLLDAGATPALTRRDWSSVPTLEHSFSALFESAFINSELLEHRRLREMEDPSLLEDWMLAIIRHDRSDMLDFLLRHGADPNVQIRCLHVCWSVGWKMLRPCTWLILAVECGSVTCVNLLVKYGAKIAHPEASGRTALQLAQANTACDHSRDFFLHTHRGARLSREVEAADDIEILAILERALEAQCESSAAIIMHPEHEILDERVKALSQATGIVLKFQRQVKNFLHGIITQTQVQHLRSVLRSVYYDPCQLSRLSFCDALLMRLVYVMSYCLLLLYEVTAIAIWLVELPRPPRGLLSAVILVLLAVVWGFYV